MPKKVINETMFEPIEVDIYGESYKVGKITETLMEALTETAKAIEGEEQSSTTAILCKQIGLYLGQPAEKFEALDIRELSTIVRFLNDEIAKQMEGETGKNLPAGAKK